MSKIIEYEIDAQKEEVRRFIKELEADKYIKYIEIDKTNVDVYTYISVAFDTHRIKSKLKGFGCTYEIIDAIIEFLDEERNVYDCYTVTDCIDSLTYGYNDSNFIFSWIDSYLEGILSEKDYNDFLDRVAMYKKYGGNPPLKLEHGLRNKGYLRY